MFGSKRRRAASNPPLNGSNANPSATSAAAQAFLKNRTSNVSLASAAAGAALRSRPTTPTSVAEVQTKRMLRRAGSTSSAGSDRSAGSNSRPQLQRRGSGSSMSERTFREPSPNRSSPVPSAADAPPVPAIPKNLSQRRSASVEAMRIASPPPNRSTGRGSSLEPTGNTPPRKLGHRSTASNAELTTRPDSRGSVNYSYPMNARAKSPLDNELTDDAPSRRPVITAPNNQNLIYDPNTRSFLPAAEIHAIEQRLRDAVNAPVKKQKRIAPKQATGSHLANGTVGGRIKGTAVDAMEAGAKQPPKQPLKPKQAAIQQQPPIEGPKVPSELEATPAPEPVQKSIPERAPEPTPEPAPTNTASPRKKKKKVAISESGSEGGSTFGSESESDVSSRPAYNHRPAVPLTKKPSIVREDREREEEEDDTPPRRANHQNTNLNYGGLGRASPDNRTESPTPLPRSAAGRGHGIGQALSSMALAEERQQTRSAGRITPEPVTPGMNGNGLAANGGARVSSVSPTRTAHFSVTPENLAVKHQPPGRSVSPRKSALKHSPSTRDDSPGGLPGSFQGGSEVSDNSVASEDHLRPKKKSVRVSFDDESTVVLGHAAPSLGTDSPVVQSPQVAKRGWFSMGRGKKKDMQSIEDEGDEVMKPRPALPSFGSVRGRKDRDTAVAPERSLVKPAEPIFDATKSPSSHLVESSTESNEFPLGPSNDHVIGAVLSQEQTARNAANISKSREPLPPEVTSVEGSGYISDDSSSTHSVEEQQLADQASPNNNEVGPEVHEVSEVRKEGIDDSAAVSSEPATTPANGTNGHVPTIAVLPATPKAEDPVPDQDWFSMPGGWEGSDNGSQQPSPQIVAQHHATDPTPADIGIAEPTPEIQPPGKPPVGEIAAAQYHPGAILEETEESDDDSIYSDAAEDLSDLEGDGFMSLDAVVESPVTSIPKSTFDIPPKTISPPESPTITSAKERAYKRSGLAQTDSQEPDLDEGWDKAQLYWSGLTAEKKRLLEQEAREEAEADTSEPEEKPAPKPKKTKKKATVKAQVEAPQQHQPALRNDRTYMIAPGSKMGPDGHTPITAPKPASTMRSSMRAEPASTASEPHMRKSMRNATSSPGISSGSMRSSMREGPPQTKGSLQKKYRPMSTPTSEIVSDPVAVSNHVRALSASSAALAQRKAAEKPVPPTLRRRGSDDSDSSFKRTRAKPEGSKFRGSMRGSAQRNESPMRSSRFSLRSLSPTGSTMRRPFSQQNNAAPPVTMRPSLRENNRNSYDSGKTPSLRLGRTKSPSGSGLMGFSRSKPTAAPILPRSRGSRFADSDSEDEKPRPAFRSRFADSDSDDDGPAPSQVRGGFSRGTMRSSAPARTAPTPSTLKPPFRKELEDGDSSDLPDSDDEKPPVIQQNKSPILTNGNLNGHKTGASLGTGTVRRSGSGRGTISSPRITDSTAITPSRPNAGRRGSFLNILKRKKADPSTKVRKSDAESPARRDTPLERSKSDRAALKAPRPMSPKLQKRNPMSRENSSSWPLPAPPAITGDDDDRPFTSDGLDNLDDKMTNSEGRPSLGTRRFTATGLSAVDVAFPETPRKKKKFQALRKMFRLDD